MSNRRQFFLDRIKPEYMFSRAIPEPNSGCWLWDGMPNTTGYCQIKIGGQNRTAHVVSYELVHGPVPGGLEVDHLCKVRCCINPAHLEPVTKYENMRRSSAWLVHKSKTHCPQGHPYTPDNIYWGTRNQRACRRCNLDRSIARTKRRQEERQRLLCAPATQGEAA